MKKHILIIEDDDVLREQIAIFLSKKGYDVTLAADGETGIRFTTDHKIDLIICDVMLPHMNGYEVMEALQTSYNTRFIPFMFISAMNEREDIRRGMASGGEDYLTKPFKLNELEASIEAIFTRYNRVEQRMDATITQLRHNISYALPHELRTPLIGVIGYADMLYEDYDKLTPGEVRSYAAGIQKSANRLHEMIENYLVYSQLEIVANEPDSHAKLKEGVCDAYSLIHDTIYKIANRHHRMGDLELNLVEARVGMAAPNLMKITRELVDNAFKFSKSGTPVHVETSIYKHYLRLHVSDHGIGIKETELKRIGAFMQFDRMHYEQQGIGLGLAIVTLLVELHEGYMRMQSKLDKGTKIELFIPLAMS